jgi:hypothetical protein
MNKASKAVITICVLGILFCIYMLVRNQWVHATRMELIDYDMKIFKQLPSYHDMMWDLTSFDVVDMINKQEQRKLELDEMYKGLKER